MNKRGAPRKRAIAIKAADALRAREFDCVTEAAHAYFDERMRRTIHAADRSSEGPARDAFKLFIAHIVEELNSRPKSLHVFRALSKRTGKRNEQRAVKVKRAAELAQIFDRALPSIRLSRELPSIRLMHSLRDAGLI